MNVKSPCIVANEFNNHVLISDNFYGHLVVVVVVVVRQKANKTNVKALKTKKTRPHRGKVGPLECETLPRKE